MDTTQVERVKPPAQLDVYPDVRPRDEHGRFLPRTVDL
jgi:hypothetical protein